MSMRRSFESLLQDLRYGFRVLVRAPAFATIAILTLALGIGANTAIFSVVNGVLINPLPFQKPDQLVAIAEKIPNFERASISYPNFVDERKMNRTFTSMAAFRGIGYNLTGSGEPEHLHGEMISAGFFETLGVKPLMGRTFMPDEDRLGANPTVMITEGLWKRKFGADPNIIGKQMILNDQSRTVVGVLPSSFHLRITNFHSDDWHIDVYTPVGEYNEPLFYNQRGSAWGLRAIGRLKPGVTLEQAREDMDRVSRELTAAYPDIDSDKKAVLTSMKAEIVGNIQPILLILLGAVVFVLLISCVNVANLLLARSTARQHEFAIRVAVGASQPRMIRQLLTESVLLAMIGGALGVLLAKFGTAAAVAAVPRTMPRAEEIGLDFRVLMFALLISVAAGVVFGLAPAFKGVGSNVGSELKESGRGFAASRSRAQSAFVMGEMAMALVLLIGAGLMIRSLFHLWGLDTGYNPHNVMTFDLNGAESLKHQPADTVRSAYRQIREQLRSVPGLEASSFSQGALPMGSDDEEYFWFVGKPKPSHQSDMGMAIQYVVEPDYLKLMRIQLQRGRFFTEADNEHSDAVVVIDERLAERYFPAQDPIGQYLDFNTDPTQDKVPNPRIIGIVRHVNQWGLDTDASYSMQAQMYVPFAQIPDKEVQRRGLGSSVFVRRSPIGGPDFKALRQQLLQANSSLVVFGAEDLEQNVKDSVSGERFTMTLLAVFAGLALLLAAIGIYGVLSYVVGRRIPEIGIRIALGARSVDVMRMVLRDGARMTLAGVGIGAVAALALTRLMSSMLFGVSPYDPLTFIAVAALLCLIALFACFVPARRATKVDPMVALRHE